MEKPAAKGTGLTEKHAAKGAELMLQAQEKLSEYEQGGVGKGVEGGGGFCCGRSPNRAGPEEVCKLYVKAANSFKVAKKWDLAGRAFAEVAIVELDNGRPNKAEFSFFEAAKCYKKVSFMDSTHCLEKCVEISIDANRTRAAAKYHQMLAEMYDENGEFKNPEKSLYHYSIAKDLHSSHEYRSATTKCDLQVAKLIAVSGEYEKAADIYEVKAQAALDSTLLRYTATDLFLRAGICRLQAYVSSQGSREDVLMKMTKLIADYEYTSPAFEDSREVVLLRSLSEAVSKSDIDAFNEAIRTFESLSRLDQWYHDIFKAIRKFCVPDLR